MCGTASLDGPPRLNKSTHFSSFILFSLVTIPTLLLLVSLHSLPFSKMSRLLYGSSNVYRNFARSTLGTDLKLVLVDCTKKTVFDAHVATLGSLPSGSLIVSSVLENFVSDFCRDLEAGEVSLFANQQITAHVESVASMVRDSSDSMAFISPLLGRRTPGELEMKWKNRN